jgi:hypothetical protein
VIFKLYATNQTLGHLVEQGSSPRTKFRPVWKFRSRALSFSKGKDTEMRVICLMLFVTWTFVVAHLYAMAGPVQLLATLAAILVSMRILSGKRTGRILK